MHIRGQQQDNRNSLRTASVGKFHPYTHTHTDVEEMFDLSFYFVFVVLGPVGT